jgi:hypothetical protein
MIQPSDALCVWHFSDAQSEYIIAARGAADASQAFDRLVKRNQQVVRRYPELEANFSGRSLAISKPGTVYRRRLAPTAKKPH